MIHFCYHSFDLRELVSFAESREQEVFGKLPKCFISRSPALSRQIK
jgi:hypothetical protein